MLCICWGVTKAAEQTGALKPHIPSAGLLRRETHETETRSVSHCSGQTDLRSLWIPPAVALAPIEPSVLPHGGL